ncbi:MAG: hypothetical protein RDV48_00835 [Candidatus Eremiobacteraeota bacterium]|nr:hypothetical protein [Candidatus Eremiobacteraeota bacterium]
MMASSGTLEKKRPWAWCAWVLALIICGCTPTLVRFPWAFPLIMALGLIPLVMTCFIPSVMLDYSLMVMLCLIFREYFFQDDVTLYLPLLAMILVTTGHRTGARLVPVASLIMVVIVRLAGYWSGLTLLHHIFTAASAFMLAVDLCTAIHKPRGLSSLKKVDVLLCSYSGNTGHFARQFTDSLKGIKVIVHRFHYYKSFRAKFNGQGLVLAFPVIGWRMPWPLLAYLIKGLPRSEGKTAFILSTAGGGPENAGFLAWLLLSLKGYTVKGCCWGVYPLNVVPFRIGPRGMYRFLDSLLPRRADLAMAETAAGEFSRGMPAGNAVTIFPFPLVFLGMLLDNPWLNAIIYRNYVWKRRCMKCGLCIRFCPAERLGAREDGYPFPRGTCALCLGCINLCPGNAMHMYCCSEYGNPYPPKFPEYVVKDREHLEAQRLHGEGQ